MTISHEQQQKKKLRFINKTPDNIREKSTKSIQLFVECKQQQQQHQMPVLDAITDNNTNENKHVKVPPSNNIDSTKRISWLRYTPKNAASCVSSSSVSSSSSSSSSQCKQVI